mmetsp:Transcript_4800/g.16924  ORF Transcript_4800/g.16924 Transcript_4800/m.16924 type:complete len:202 (+) Transcript_4800:3098-3703(+)
MLGEVLHLHEEALPSRNVLPLEAVAPLHVGLHHHPRLVVELEAVLRGGDAVELLADVVVRDRLASVLPRHPLLASRIVCGGDPLRPRLSRSDVEDLLEVPHLQKAALELSWLYRGGHLAEHEHCALPLLDGERVEEEKVLASVLLVRDGHCRRCLGLLASRLLSLFSSASGRADRPPVSLLHLLEGLLHRRNNDRALDLLH